MQSKTDFEPLDLEGVARMRRRLFAVTALALVASTLSLGAAPQMSADPKRKGQEIAAESLRRDAGFGDYRSQMTMQLMSDGREVDRRTLHMKVLEGSGGDDGGKSLIVIETPESFRGTALLTHTHSLAPDDQWIFIPAISRTKRINSANKSGPFLGTEFAYEDLAAPALAKYDYEWLRDEACPPPDAASRCHMVEQKPLYEYSGYRRQISWIDTADYLVRKIDFYNQENRLHKTLTLANYKRHSGHWRAHQLRMSNHQTGRSTNLDVTSVNFKTGLTHADFTEETLGPSR